MPRGKNLKRSNNQNYSRRTNKTKSPKMLLKSPQWKTASADLFTEPIGTPSPFRNRVLTRRSSMYVRTLKSGTGSLRSPTFKAIQKVGGQVKTSVVSRVSATRKIRKESSKTISQTDISDERKTNTRKKTQTSVITMAETNEQVKKLASSTSRKVVSSKSPSGLSTSSKVTVKNIAAQAEKARQTRSKSGLPVKTSMQIITDGKVEAMSNARRNVKNASENNTKTKNDSLSTPQSPELSKSANGITSPKMKKSVTRSSKKLSKSTERKKSPLKSLRKMGSPRVLLVNTPFTSINRKVKTRSVSSKRQYNAKKSPQSPGKTILSATEMKKLLDDATDDESFSTPCVTRNINIQVSLDKVRSKSRKGRSNPLKKSSEGTPKETAISASRQKLTTSVTAKTPRTRIEDGISPKSNVKNKHKEDIGKNTPKSYSSPALAKSVSHGNRSLHKSKSEAAQRETLKKGNGSYEVSVDSSRSSRKTVKIIASEVLTPRSPIHRQLTPGRAKSNTSFTDKKRQLGKRVLTESKSDANVTPIKAARILGKIQLSTTGVSKINVDTPRTSTPATSAVKKRSAVIVPPVSEIRQSKRIRKDILSENSTLFTSISKENTIDTLNIGVAKSQDIQTVIEEESSHVQDIEEEHCVQLDVENKKSWWGYCNVM